MKITLKNEKSYIIDLEITTSYFKLEKGSHLGVPISPYILIYVLEITFALIKS